MGTCPSCGANRMPESSFCWRCYARFADARPRGARQGSVVAVQETETRKERPLITFGRSRPENRRGTVHIGGIVGPTIIGFIVLALAYGVWWYQGERAIELPRRIGGMTQVDPPQGWQRSIDRAEKELRHPVTGAWYAEPGVSGIMVLAAAGQTPYETAEELLVAELQTVADPAVFFRPSRVRSFSSPSGAGLACVPIRGVYFPSVCSWMDSQTVGFVFTTGERTSTARYLALQAHDAIRAR